MKAIRFALGLLIAVPSTVYGQYEPTITMIHAVANNRDDPAGAKEIALKDKISASCDGKSFCIYKGPELVPNETFLIEDIFLPRPERFSSAKRSNTPQRHSRDSAVLQGLKRCASELAQNH